MITVFYIFFSRSLFSMTIFPFLHPSTFLLAGPTGSGKTYFVSRILTEKLISPFPSRIIWIYSEWQSVYNLMQETISGLEFIKGPFTEEIYDSLAPSTHNLIILDDQMTDVNKSNIVGKLFVQGSHHRNVSVMYLVQNLFEKGQQHRTLSLNSHYTIIFKNPRDNTQSGVLGRQMFPNKWRQFIKAYENATEKPYGYLVVDFRQETEENLRLRTSIFPSDEENTEIYQIIEENKKEKK